MFVPCARLNFRDLLIGCIFPLGQVWHCIRRMRTLWIIWSVCGKFSFRINLNVSVIIIVHLYITDNDKQNKRLTFPQNRCENHCCTDVKTSLDAFLCTSMNFGARCIMTPFALVFGHLQWEIKSHTKNIKQVGETSKIVSIAKHTQTDKKTNHVNATGVCRGVFYRPTLHSWEWFKDEAKWWIFLKTLSLRRSKSWVWCQITFEAGDEMSQIKFLWAISPSTRKNTFVTRIFVFVFSPLVCKSNSHSTQFLLVHFKQKDQRTWARWFLNSTEWNATEWLNQWECVCEWMFSCVRERNREENNRLTQLFVS